ncbi:hypothetical protein HMPREF1868_01763 [Olsenella sp. DNF00959]|nr:hypothetical protein HMPREF1868_01763 [Olsenella sp. DNF00959]
MDKDIIERAVADPRKRSACGGWGAPAAWTAATGAPPDATTD